MLKKGTFLLLICIAVIAASLIFQQEKKSTYAKKAGEVTFTGIDLNCKGCENKVNTAIQNIIGINRYEFDKKHNTITVFYNEQVMKPDWIANSLKASGFKPKDFH